MIIQPLLAQITNPPTNWLPVLLLLVIAIGFAVVNVAASIIIGPSRTGAVKSSTYESGMVPMGDTRRRFNVRFYVVAMIFLVFDVEIVFFYPWASIFPKYANMANSNMSTTMIVEMGVFIAILLLAYIYAWGKGVFRWD